MADRNDRLGFDMKARADLDRDGRSSSGAELVIDAVHRRITTGQLPLIDSDDGNADFGEDVRLWLGEKVTEEQLVSLVAYIKSLSGVDPNAPAAAAPAANTSSAQSGSNTAAANSNK